MTPYAIRNGGKTCHNSCSGGIVIAVNPSFVATGDVQKSTAQTDMSVKTWGYGVMDSIGGFEPLDPGSIPGISATLNREDER